MEGENRVADVGRKEKWRGSLGPRDGADVCFYLPSRSPLDPTELKGDRVGRERGGAVAAGPHRAE